MSLSVYIYGPTGCGKSTHAKEFAKLFALDNIWDEFDPSFDLWKPDTLHLGTTPWPSVRTVTAYSYAEALALLEEAK